MAKNGKSAWVGALSLAFNALAVMISSDISPVAEPAGDALNTADETRALQINSASVASIEKSFIEVPAVCKARSAAFDPVTVGSEAIPASVLAIHSALDQAVGAVA